MHGPIAATVLCGSAPCFSISRRQDAATPETVPLQPACAAPITRFSGSQNSIGTQSAVFTAMIIPGTSVTNASHSYSPPGRSV